MEEEEHLFQSILRLERFLAQYSRHGIIGKAIRDMHTDSKKPEDDKGKVLVYVETVAQVANDLIAQCHDENKLMHTVYNYLESKHSRSSQNIMPLLSLV